MYTATLTFPLSERFLSDVLTTFVEGGNYWAYIGRVERNADLDVLSLRDVRDAETAARLARDFTLAGVSRGIQLALDYRTPEGRSARWYATIASAVADDDAGIIDADLADVIVQLALFGDLIYG